MKAIIGIIIFDSRLGLFSGVKISSPEKVTFKDFIVRDLEQVLEKLMNQIIKHSPVLDKPKDVTIHLQNGDI